MKKPPAKEKKVPSEKKGSERPNQIVAIGASAGGLEAITELLKNLLPNTGMIYIYIPHLSPDHKSILTSLLAKVTAMKVREVTDKILMQPNHFYIIPPDKEMTVLDGHIQLSPRAKNYTVHLPIDTFFTSLAASHMEDTVGVVLSGSASDGKKGLLAIKASGGLTFAQDDSAKFNSMPKSAITSGAVDFVLSPKEIAMELIRISKHDKVKRNLVKAAEVEIDNSNPDLKAILDILLKQKLVDFGQYKMPTIKRRIVRRMLLNNIESLNEYALLIGEKTEEVNLLYQDLLINVTNFFRDTDAHEYLKSTLLPKLLKSKTDNEKLRIWIPACATGEEAYSIAMTILEIQAEQATNIPVQIFATDLSAQAIAFARIGEYPKADLEMVSPKRLQRFYTKTGSKFRISKVVRDMCVFAPHNILRDPPFSRVDFISCCNLFIYLDPAAQKKVLGTFYYALNENGFLMLGKSETIGTSELFTPINNNFSIYSKKRNSRGSILPELQPRIRNRTVGKKDVATPDEKNADIHPISYDKEIDAILLSAFMPASVVINHKLDILQFRGNTDAFLRHKAGKASFNILQMSPPEIAFELRHSIPIAIKTKEPLIKAGIEVKDASGLKMVSVQIIPLALDWEEPLLLIVFTKPELVETFLQQGKSSKSNLLAKDRKINKLEKELGTAKFDMQSFAQDQEAFIEELQSAHEEVVSSNEELQSVNEELETSKEEIESTNEELTTTNQELQTRNELLNESYQYSDAILANIHEPLLVLDKDFRIVSASKSFYKKFTLKPEETEGMLLYNIGDKEWDIPALRQLLEDIVPKNAEFYDFEVTHTFSRLGEKIMLLNAKRIKQKLHHDQLILLAIADITDARTRAVESVQKEKDILTEHNLALEKAVADRTVDLKEANINLEENNLSLKILNRELESFSYVASHDLQEPLRKIQTLANRILESEDSLSEKGKDYFERIRYSAFRMQTLIKDLLSFSSLQHGNNKKYQKIDLNTIVEEVKAELYDIIQEKKASFVIGDLCEVNVEPSQFVQAVTNLISNSLKFSSPIRPLVITINSTVIKNTKINDSALLPLKDYCQIIIADNGIGFEEEYNRKIFDVFQRLHSKEEYPGTGIGLAIVKKIVENHNGVVTARGQIGEGAVFEIYIPVEPRDPK